MQGGVNNVELAVRGRRKKEGGGSRQGGSDFKQATLRCVTEREEWRGDITVALRGATKSLITSLRA